MLCDAIDGYTDDGTNNTMTRPCFYTCKTCSNLATCDSCNLVVNHRILNNGTMNCDAIDGFYDDGTNPIAQPCYYSCSTCNNGVICQTCNSSYFRVFNSGTNMCDAVPGYYDDGSN